MRRVKAACLCQTLHFQLSEKLPHPEAVQQVHRDIENYKRTLERSRVQYRILEETAQPDGSVMMKIKKQYNSSPVGEYLND